MTDAQQPLNLSAADKQAACDRLLQGIAEEAGGNFDYRLELEGEAARARRLGTQF